MPTLLYHKFALNSHANVLNTTDSCKELKLFPNQFMNVFRMHRKLQEYETENYKSMKRQPCTRPCHKFAIKSHANVLNTTDSCKELKLFPNQFMNVFRMHRKLQEYETPTMHPTLPQVCDQLAAAHAVWQPIVGLPSPGSS
mmetsp:Transcript_9794/g.18374  ORF Transcript_9794/g.18374 Transcript_9794/m.18374 type:complete len:141 (+) Transcript_9794:1055-1477(+)